MEKGQLKRPAHSAPGSVSPSTGGTNPRRGQSTRSGNGAPDCASPGSGVANSRANSETPSASEWLTKTVFQPLATDAGAIDQ